MQKRRSSLSGFRGSKTTSRLDSGDGRWVEDFFEKKPSRRVNRSGRVSRTKRMWAGSSPVGKGIGLPLCCTDGVDTERRWWSGPRGERNSFYGVGLHRPLALAWVGLDLR